MNVRDGKYCKTIAPDGGPLERLAMLCIKCHNCQKIPRGKKVLEKGRKGAERRRFKLSSAVLICRYWGGDLKLLQPAA